MKTIKKSKRGLTFSLEDESKIGSKFRYVINKNTNEILIIEDETGKGTVSRKKSGKRFKPLYDIRSKEVKELVANADYLEIEENGVEIIVHVIKKVKKFQRLIRSNIIHLGEILGIKTGEIRLSKAAGMEGQFSFFDSVSLDEYLSSSGISINNTIHAQPVDTAYRVMSLFSGAGLLDYAFATKPQYKFVYANDACILDGKFSPEVADTYYHNIGCKMTIKDIREVTPDEIPDCDLALGGPCCQAYSSENRTSQETEEGEAKRHLVDDYIRLIKAKKPKAFVIENVKGLLSRDEGKILTDALSTIPEYEISATIIKDYEVGGYTQRERAIVIGSRIGRIELPNIVQYPVKTVRDALSKIDDTWEKYPETVSSDNVRLIMSYVPQGENWKVVPSSIREFGKSTHSNVYHRLAWDKPAKTITNWRKCCITHPDEDRIISINEASALMGLDKNFKFFGKIGAIQQMIGNGVTNAMATLIERCISKKFMLALQN